MMKQYIKTTNNKKKTMSKRFFRNTKAVAASACAAFMMALAACSSEPTLQSVADEFNQRLPFKTEGLEVKDIALEDTFAVFNCIFDEASITVPEFKGAEKVMKPALFHALHQAGMDPFIDDCITTNTSVVVSMKGNKTDSISRAVFSIEDLRKLIVMPWKKLEREQAAADSIAKASADTVTKESVVSVPVKK